MLKKYLYNGFYCACDLQSNLNFQSKVYSFAVKLKKNQQKSKKK